MTDSRSSSVPDLDELRAALVLQREADAMIAEALDTKRSAVERAEALVHEAEEAAARAEADAAAAAASRIASAREEAERLIAEAEEQAHQITSAAHAEVADLRHDAAELRDSAQETIEAAELELERARRSEEQRQRQLRALRAETIRMSESLEHLTATLDELLGAEAASPSVVLQWPHHLGAAGVVDDAATGEGDTVRPSKHRRADGGGRRGLLRKARP